MNDPFYYIIEKVKLDLEVGPYVTGGRVLHEIEKVFRTPNYQPKDVDIVCRNIDQKNIVVEALTPFYSFIGSKTVPLIDVPWKKNKFKLLTKFVFKSRTRKGKVDLILTDQSATEKIRSHDFSIVKVACCNKYTLASPQTLSDIKDRFLRLNLHKDFVVDKQSVHDSMLFPRINKYLKRAYRIHPELHELLKKIQEFGPDQS